MTPNKKQTPSDKRLDFTRAFDKIQVLAPDWTDYNGNDPGITILELLCYAITDLGYRSSKISDGDAMIFVNMLLKASKVDSVDKKDPRFRRFERSLFGACRAVLEIEAKAAIDEMRAKSTSKDVQTVEEAELLQVLGYSHDEQGIIRFLWDNRYRLAAMCHDFKIPHDCETSCKKRENLC